MKTSKKRFGKKKFQLDEEEENLTHLGASIGEIETFRDDYVGSDEEEGFIFFPFFFVLETLII